MKNLNLIVSCWPASGGTTMALILAWKLGLKYIYAGGVLKEWAKIMGYDPSSNAFHEWEEKYGEDWDRFWENYIQHKFLNVSSSNQGRYLCEGKTAGFMLPSGIAYELMVKASDEVRAERAGFDNRTEDLTNRDKLLRDRWIKLFDVDIYSLPELGKNYNYILDNSNLGIADSVEVVLNDLKHSKYYSELKVSDQNLVSDFLGDKKEIKAIEEKFWHESKEGRSGKDWLKERLYENNLYYTNKEIFLEWTNDYQNELSKLPNEMQQAVITSTKK